MQHEGRIRQAAQKRAELQQLLRQGESSLGLKTLSRRNSPSSKNYRDYSEETTNTKSGLSNSVVQSSTSNVQQSSPRRPPSPILSPQRNRRNIIVSKNRNDPEGNEFGPKDHPEPTADITFASPPNLKRDAPHPIDKNVTCDFTKSVRPPRPAASSPKTEAKGNADDSNYRPTIITEAIDTSSSSSDTSITESQGLNEMSGKREDEGALDLSATNARLASILDGLEKAEKRAAIQTRARSPQQNNFDKESSEQKIEQSNQDSDQEPPQLRKASNVFAGVKSRMEQLNRELEEKTKALALAKRQVKEAQHTVTKEREEFNARTRAKLGRQKEEYEAIVARHLSMIDQLLGDKQALATKVETISEQFSFEKKSIDRRIRAIKESAAVELQKAKEKWRTSEKRRIDELVNAKAKEVKDKTIKSLEPEIQKLIDKHKTDVEKLKTTFEQELQRREDQLKQAHQQEVLQLRQGIDSAVEATLAKEKEELRAREKSIRADAEAEIAAMRRRVGDDMTAEQRRGMESLRQQSQQHAMDLQRLRDRYEQQIVDMSKRTLHEREEWQRRLDDAVAHVRRTELDQRESWRSEMRRALRAEAKEREASERDGLRRERDEQLQKIIAKMDAEMQREREQLRQSADDRVKAAELKGRKNIESFQSYIHSLEEQLKTQSQQCTSNEQTLNESMKKLQEKNSELEKELSAATYRVQTLEEKCASLTSSLDEAHKTLQSERDRTAVNHAASEKAHQDTVRRLESEMEELTRNHNESITNLRRRKAAELRELESRVARVLQANEKRVEDLQQQLHESHRVQQATEQLFEQQQRELLGDK